MNGTVNKHRYEVLPAIVADVGQLTEQAAVWLKKHLIETLIRGAVGMSISTLAAFGMSVWYPTANYSQIVFIVSFCLFAAMAWRASRFVKRWRNYLVTLKNNPYNAGLEEYAEFRDAEQANLFLGLLAAGALTISCFLGYVGAMNHSVPQTQEKSVRRQIKGIVENSTTLIKAPAKELATDGIERIEPSLPKGGTAQFVSTKSVSSISLPDQQRASYFQRFSKIAIGEKDKFGIPASIILAQGALESANGMSILASQHNAHFGIKCWEKNCDSGHCSPIVTIHKGDKAGERYRNFASAWESYRAHSEWLTDKSVYYGKYAALARQNANYKRWAESLQKWHYATDPNYGANLVAIIEKWQLQKLDDL
jgi:flagellum-specific peptidoglycan hydrolase FlgJ